ncbi:MAG: hypothetical protein MJ148_00990 [Clostridia bacterium]|nr:hypothetical protein [Clostridia bacterium]
MNSNFVPVILGNDINAYSMARSFYEAYGVTSVVVAKTKSGFVSNTASKVIKFYEYPDLDNSEEFITVMTNLRQEFQGKDMIILGCADNYVRTISNNKETLQSIGYIVPVGEKSVIDNIMRKEIFYELCDRYRISHPKTFVYKPWMDYIINYNFPYPMIVKPADTVDYHNHSFPGQKKIYSVASEEELIVLLKRIYEAGYMGNMIVQETIPGGPSNEYDMQIYVGHDHKAKLVSLARVLVIDEDDKTRGNNLASITTYNESLMKKISHVLELIGYEGFADADIKYDERDGEFKVLEINARQGGSHYRVTGSGHNLAKLLVEDQIEHEPKELELVNTPYYWSIVPHKVVYAVTDDKELLEEVRELLKSGHFGNSLDFEKDNTFKRRQMLRARSIKLFNKYIKYYLKS